MSTQIAELKTQLEGNRAKATELIGKASSDTGLTDEDKVTLKELHEETSDIVQRIEAAKSDQQALDALKGLFPAPAKQDSDDTPATPASFGKAFIESDEYRAAVKGLGPNDQVPEGRRVEPVSMPNMFKALVRGNGTPGNDGVATPLLPTTRLGVVDVAGFKPRVFRDLVDVQTSDSPLIEFIRQEFTNNAAGVPEATTTDPIGGEVTAAAAGLKPQSKHKWTEDSVSARTIAHWEPVTRRMLNNAPQVAGIIEGDLLEGLEDELEDQGFNGAGGSDLVGIGATAGIQSQGFVTDIFTTLLKARTKVRIGGRTAATAHVLDPATVESILLAREGGATGAFVYGGPAQVAALSVWGIPVVESERLPNSTAFTADWKKVKLYDVVRAAIAWTDSHADFFTRNIEVVRAEMDVALAVFRPAAIVQVSTGASS